MLENRIGNLGGVVTLLELFNRELQPRYNSKLDSINLKDDYKYKVNNEIIDSVLVRDITLYFKVNKLNKIIEKRCSDFVEKYLLKLCIYLDIEVDNPSYKVSSTYIINEDDNNILTFKNSVKIIHIYNKDSFILRFLILIN